MSQPKILKVEQSKLFRLGRKRDIARLLGLGTKELIALSKDSNFKEWPKREPGKKDRIIEEPSEKLAKILESLYHCHLKKIETPSWLLSGKKGVRPRDNADFHKENSFMINVDIQGFYQSAKREFVFRSFRDTFGQSNDVAALLADLVTYKGHVPTGTATSQAIAFWAYKPFFERINNLCQSKGILMTVWVDDITFSSLMPFPKGWLRGIEKIAMEYDLALKKEKTKIYGAKNYKCVTGSVISPSGNILIKNQKRKEIVDLLEGKKIEELRMKETRKLFGKLVAQRQNEPDFYQVVYARTKKHLKLLEAGAQVKVPQ